MALRINRQTNILFSSDFNRRGEGVICLVPVAVSARAVRYGFIAEARLKPAQHTIGNAGTIGLGGAGIRRAILEVGVLPHEKGFGKGRVVIKPLPHRKVASGGIDIERGNIKTACCSDAVQFRQSRRFDKYSELLDEPWNYDGSLICD